MQQQSSARWREKAWVGFLSVAPLRAYTQVVRAIAGISVPRPLRAPVLGQLAERLGMDLSEAEHDVAEYDSFGELFVRRLQDGRRPVDGDPTTVTSPVDACVSTCGIASGDHLLQAKGIEYSLADFLGDAQLAERLAGGAFATLYLRPKDYHRIHTPVAGRVVATRRLPGELFPVQPSVVRNLRGLFARNERLVVELETDVGVVALVAVGATAVGCITTVFGAPPGHRRYDPPLEMSKGQEIAAFNLGSTVILVFEPGRVALSSLPTGQEVRVGQVIGRAQVGAVATNGERATSAARR